MQFSHLTSLGQFFWGVSTLQPAQLQVYVLLLTCICMLEFKIN